MDNLRVLELFSGIGGMHFALKNSGVPGQIIASVDINPIANDVYTHNFPDVAMHNRNVQFVTAAFVKKSKANCILMSPPCQPFTRVGHQKDIDDARTDAFVYLCGLIPQLTTVNKILMENVKGFEGSKARDMFVQALQDGGYCYQEFLLSPTVLGVPNSRTRYYCIARKGLEFPFLESGKILENFPSRSDGHGIATASECRRTIKEYVDDAAAVMTNDECYAYIGGDVIKRRGLLMDIVYPDSISSTCFTKAYTRYIEGTGSVYTELSKADVTDIFAKFETDEFNGECIARLKLRFFTPREVARLMCFPESFEFPANTTDKQKYRLLGNSLNVLVVSHLIKLLCCNS